MTTLLHIFALWAALLSAPVSITCAAAQTIDLRVGSDSSLVLDRAFETVMIGDSDVVDVHARDNRSVMLEPLAPGTTNLIFLDDQISSSPTSQSRFANPPSTWSARFREDH